MRNQCKLVQGKEIKLGEGVLYTYTINIHTDYKWIYIIENDIKFQLYNFPTIRYSASYLIYLVLSLIF